MDVATHLFMTNSLSTELNDSIWREYHIDIETNLVTVTIIGKRGTAQNELKTQERYWSKIMEACILNGIKKILIISNVEGKLTSSVSQQIILLTKRLGFCEGYQIGLADLNYESYLDNMMSECFAKRQGLNGKLFNNEVEARSWLEAQ